MSGAEGSSSQKSKLTNVDTETFAKAMGQAVWLLTMSKEHRDLPIREIERIVSTPVFLGQFKIYSKGNSPAAFLSWASTSKEVEARIKTGNKVLNLEDWRSRKSIVVVECVSPFNPADVFAEKFWQGLAR